jgi:hypothetical protein
VLLNTLVWVNGNSMLRTNNQREFRSLNICPKCLNWFAIRDELQVTLFFYYLHSEELNVLNSFMLTKDPQTRKPVQMHKNLFHLRKSVQ